MPTKIVKKILPILPDTLALRIIGKAAGIVKPLDVREFEQAALSQAKPIYLGQKKQIRAWEWGTGPIVVLIHGWGGQASQMAPHAMEIAKRGFRCIIFDVTGHGRSSKNYTQWDYFIRDITDLSNSLNEEIYAYIGHSAGGMTMMAAHHHGRIQAKKLICVCAPSFPFPPIEGVRRKLNPRASVMSLYKAHISKQFEIPWNQLETSEFYTNPTSKMLLIYDKKDKFVPHTEGDKIHTLHPNSSLVKTEEYGHTRILASEELNTIVGDFLSH
ncbi:alpha/beta fold hydrolase [Sneathiella aquimaris]|uniref:alpha/beta fold hydrolase n=1 Tax=Sneathiella aquimaris TaxID=2599305 RepID=UPI00146E6A9D|nr:alpha/beta fold hydrolase [Sneathiella aquimaris]